MSRIVYIFIAFIVTLNANEVSISFKETRHIDAFNEKIVKKGVIGFSNDSARIYYEPPNEKEITMQNGNITIKTCSSTVVKNAKEEPNIANMFILFRALFENNDEQLKKFFKVTKKTKDEVVLNSISSSNPVSVLTYELKNNDIVKLEILGQNGDRITIDVVEKK